MSKREKGSLIFNENPPPFIPKPDLHRLALRKAKEQLIQQLSEVMQISISQSAILVKCSDFNLKRVYSKYSNYKVLEPSES